MKRRRQGERWLAALGLALSLSLAAPGAAQDEAPVAPVNLSAQQLEEARKIKSEVMAPCCWNGTVDSHNSPAAVQIASRIDRSVAEGQTRAQILESLTGEYGERILAKPRTEGFGLIFYVGPAAALIFGGIFVSHWLRRNVRPPRPEAPAAAQPTAAAPADRAWEQRFEEQLKQWDQR